MHTPYGLRTELSGTIWKDLADEFVTDGIVVRVANCVMEIGYHKEGDYDKAKKIGELYIKSQNLRTGSKITYDFNYAWRPNNSGKTVYSISVSDKVHIAERTITQSHFTIGAYLITQETHDSGSFSNNTILVKKALKNYALEQALTHFSDEVVDDNRPLYGIYKAIEIITKHLGGRKALAALSNQNEKYISDLMETTNTQRHAVTYARRRLSNEECKERAKTLILAYANSL